MKVSLFCTNGYHTPEVLGHGGWPVPPGLYRADCGLRAVEAALAQAQLADELGFDWVSCSEHHYTPLRQTPSSAVFAAALSQVVRRARIALLGPLVSMNNPVRIAEELAMVDQLSGGRVIALFLRGTPNEFLTYHNNPAETRARTQEATVLIRRALSERQPFGWDGRFYQFRTIAVWPGPIQRPHPPLYYSGNSNESASFAAARHLGLGVSFFPPALVARIFGQYKLECAQHGWQPAADQLLYRAFIVIGRNDREAAARQEKYFGGGALGQIFRGRGAAVALPELPRPAPGADTDHGLISRVLQTVHFSGSPETVRGQLTSFAATTGAGVVDLYFGGPGLSTDEVVDSIQLFGSEVLPRIRELNAPAGLS